MKKIIYGIFGWFGFLALLFAVTAPYDQTSQLGSSLIGINDQAVVLSEEVEPIESIEEIDTAFIEVSSIDTSNSNGAYYYRGTTSANCSKIIVEARNSSTGLYDYYQLSDYQYGDTSYYYGIRDDWNNLDEGLMEYVFTAYCDGDQIETIEANYSYSKPSQKYTNTSSSSTASSTTSSFSSGTNYYINVDGNAVQSPTYYTSQPSGASAKCKDGTYSFSQNRSGTCSGHGGVSTWY